MNSQTAIGRFVARIAFTVACLSSSIPATAQDAWGAHPYLTDKYHVSLGVFFPERSFKIGVDASVPGLEAQIDVSKRFKLDTSDTTQAMELGWRFGKKWLLRGQHFSVDGSRSATLDEDVEWGDYTFGVGTGVVGGIDVTITRLYFGYTIRRDNVHEFGVGGGVHRLDISAFIRGQAIVNNKPPEFVERRVSTTGPLPNFGGWYLRSLSRRWALFARLDWLSADIDRYDGTIINASVGANLAITRHFGVGFAYNHFELDVGVKDDHWKGEVEQKIDGPYVHLSASW